MTKPIFSLLPRPKTHDRVTDVRQSIRICDHVVMLYNVSLVRRSHATHRASLQGYGVEVTERESGVTVMQREFRDEAEARALFSRSLNRLRAREADERRAVILDGDEPHTGGYVVYGQDLVLGGAANLGSYATADEAIARWAKGNAGDGYLPFMIVARTASNPWGK